MSLTTPEGYYPLDSQRLKSWLGALPALAAKVGGAPVDWRISEVSDGNLNVVFLVRGTLGGVCVKQSLPYVRSAGESWPMPLERAYFEYQHSQVAGVHLAGLIPETYYYDEVLFASVMELLEPHIILRQGLIAGQRYPSAVNAVAEFVARSAVLTSTLAQPFEAVFDQSAIFARNHALTRVTVELVFADPFEDLERNRWTSPELDQDVAAMRANVDLRAAVARLGQRFLTEKQALLHGDLHTGSVMVSDSDTRVIDPEFAQYGPVGFDVGMFIANLLMGFFSQAGHASAEDSRQEHGAWILAQVGAFWRHFAQRYDALWLQQSAGDAWPRRLFSAPEHAEAFASARRARQGEIYRDALGFAGAEIIRRILGFAHNQDFEAITDSARRAGAERRALTLARELLLNPRQFDSIELLLQHARYLALPGLHRGLAEVQQQVIFAGRFAAARGWVPATSGNFSARLDHNHVVLTRSGRDKGQLNVHDLAIVALDQPLPPGLSAEAPLHLARYRADPEIGAIYHVHSASAASVSRHAAHAQGLRLRGWELQKAFAGVSSHTQTLKIPVFANSQDTVVLAARIEAELEGEGTETLAPGYLLSGHGLYAWGRDGHEALRHLEAFDALLQLQLNSGVQHEPSVDLSA